MYKPLNKDYAHPCRLQPLITDTLDNKTPPRYNLGVFTLPVCFVARSILAGGLAVERDVFSYDWWPEPHPRRKSVVDKTEHTCYYSVYQAES
jgi:hypothetical protein